ncbi:MAG: serine/threonine protein phosphatase [Magnetococcales bacterium]|nr:serine/threonine protein phosphatase [Magnetococcales bacterium]
MGVCCVSGLIDDAKAGTGNLSQQKEIKGVSFPENLGLSHLVVTGPPGVGKSTLMGQIGGWPQEGYVDLSMDKWWRSPALSYRPREVHFGFPFVGVEPGLAVFDEEWLKNYESLELDFDRIKIPPDQNWFLSPDWKSRYVFEFLLPPPKSLLNMRKERARRGTHLVDKELTIEQVSCQVAIYWAVALHLHRSGMKIYIREGYTANLHCFQVPLYKGVEVSQDEDHESLAGWCGTKLLHGLGKEPQADISSNL